MNRIGFMIGPNNTIYGLHDSKYPLDLTYRVNKPKIQRGTYQYLTENNHYFIIYQIYLLEREIFHINDCREKKIAINGKVYSYKVKQYEDLYYQFLQLGKG
jgi:hypothetical protein